MDVEHKRQLQNELDDLKAKLAQNESKQRELSAMEKDCMAQASALRRQKDALLQEKKHLEAQVREFNQLKFRHGRSFCSV